MKFYDEKTCEGIWENDKNLCKGEINCCEIYRNGFSYTGGCVNGKFEGRGEFVGNYLEYYGDWKEDKIHGEGKLKGNIIIEGIFDRG